MENETKFTPGPWAVREDSWGVEVYPLYDGPPDFGEWSAIAKVEDCYDDEDQETAANAHLISAAPELYEALVEALSELEAYEGLATGEDYNSPKINAALSKAKGRNQ